MAQANAECGDTGVDDGLDHWHRILARCRRVAGAVGQEHAIGLVAQNFIGGGVAGNDGDSATGGGEATQNIFLRAEIDGDDMICGVALGGVAVLNRPFRLIPLICLSAADFFCQIRTLE